MCTLTSSLLDQSHGYTTLGTSTDFELKKKFTELGKSLGLPPVNALSKYGVFYSQSDSAIGHLVDLLRTMEQAVFVSTEDTYGHEFGPNLAA